MRAEVLDYHFSNMAKKENSVFSPRLIITSFEQKALCCVVGVMGPPAGLDESHVHLRFHTFLCLSLKVTDSSMRRSDGTAGCVIGAQTLKELQTHIIKLRELGNTERLSQVVSSWLFIREYVHGRMCYDEQ